MTKGTRRTLAVLLGGSLVLGGMTGTMAATKKVRAKGEKWRPVHTYIARGDQVRWTNPTNKVHDIKAYGRGWKFSKILSRARRRRSDSRSEERSGSGAFGTPRSSAVSARGCAGSSTS
jgi:plastocyanin